MAITIDPKFNGESGADGENAAGQVEYLIRDPSGTATFNGVRAAFAALAPATNGDLVLDHVEVSEQLNEGSTSPMGEFWRGTAHYKLPEKVQKEPGERVQISFRTTGGTQKITQAKEHISDFSAVATPAPNHHGAINVTEDGPEGVDTTFPAFEFEERWIVAAADITPEYINTLFRLTGQVNDAVFRAFAVGEVLFLGAEGTNRPDGDYDLTFKFSCSANASDFSVGDATVSEKLGWWYLWVEYAKSEDTSAKRTVHKPIAVHLERVYDSGDFSGLGIGT